MDVEHVTWWDAPVRPVLAVIINRPWAPAAAQGRAYKVAQHACSSHVQGQAFTSQGKSHLRMLDLDSEPPCSMHDMKPDPGSCTVVGLQHCKGHQGPTPQPPSPDQGQAPYIPRRPNPKTSTGTHTSAQTDPDPGSDIEKEETLTRRRQGQTLSPPPLLGNSRQHAWRTGTRARMPATRARRKHWNFGSPGMAMR